MSRLALITFLSGGNDVDPGYGVNAPSGRPDNSLPGFGGRPDNSLPGLPPGSTLLPVLPFDPTTGPDNSLPGSEDADTKPIRPGRKYVVKWLACHGLVLVPDNTLPETPEPK